MELTGFDHSLMNKKIGMIVKDESECYIPWEFLHSSDSFSHKLLITNNKNKHKNLLISNDWNSVWNIGTNKDWSCIATTLKAHSGHILIVFDIHFPEKPYSFINFIQNLIEVDHKSITMIDIIKLGSYIGYYDCLFWSIGQNPEDVYTTITNFVSNNSHISFKYSFEVVESLVEAVNKEKAELVLSYDNVRSGRENNMNEIKLYWSKKEDSFYDHSEIIKKCHSFIRSSMNVIEFL
jgi:hypothetical protein